MLCVFSSYVYLLINRNSTTTGGWGGPDSLQGEQQGTLLL